VSQLIWNILFVTSVTIIWFMLAYQIVLFFLGYRYYRHTRRASMKRPPVPETELGAVSVLVPCHNEEIVIARTLKALLKLDYPKDKIEILIIDDGSTDRTAEVVRDCAKDHPCIRLLQVPAAMAVRGKPSALNFGLRHARHPLIAVYDADNVPEPDALRPLVEQLALDGALAAAIGMYRTINRHRTWLTRFINIEGIAFQWILQAGRWMLMRLTGLPGTNYVIRREVLEELGGWDEQSLTEDAEMTVRIYRLGRQVQFVPVSRSWEQEPEALPVWFRQRRRWVRGSNYLVRKYTTSLLRMRPRRIGLELLYSLALYYFFFLAVIVSDLLFLLCMLGLIHITVPGPYGLVWVFAYVTFALQVVIALSCEQEDSLGNILLTVLMYFTYCQLWIPVVALALYDDFIARREVRWAKTERFEIG
jgi:cellulose synthase/poly-beta-1,6-N-acetylglucosamine synthase-like glycosyltransferase